MYIHYTFAKHLISKLGDPEPANHKECRICPLELLKLPNYDYSINVLPKTNKAV